MASEAIKVQLCSIGKSKFIMTYEKMKKKKPENDNTVSKDKANGD